MFLISWQNCASKSRFAIIINQKIHQQIPDGGEKSCCKHIVHIKEGMEIM